VVESVGDKSVAEGYYCSGSHTAEHPPFVPFFCLARPALLLGRSAAGATTSCDLTGNNAGEVDIALDILPVSY